MPLLNKQVNYDILGALLVQWGTDYINHIPNLREKNIVEVDAILDYQPAKEDFIIHFPHKNNRQLFEGINANNVFKF